MELRYLGWICRVWYDYYVVDELYFFVYLWDVFDLFDGYGDEIFCCVVEFFGCCVDFCLCVGGVIWNVL